MNASRLIRISSGITITVFGVATIVLGAQMADIPDPWLVTLGLAPLLILGLLLTVIGYDILRGQRPTSTLRKVFALFRS